MGDAINFLSAKVCRFFSKQFLGIFHKRLWQLDKSCYILYNSIETCKVGKNQCNQVFYRNKMFPNHWKNCFTTQGIFHFVMAAKCKIISFSQNNITLKDFMIEGPKYWSKRERKNHDVYTKFFWWCISTSLNKKHFLFQKFVFILYLLKMRVTFQ